MNPINDRKMDHINIVSNDGDIDRRKYCFDRMSLTLPVRLPLGRQHRRVRFQLSVVSSWRISFSLFSYR
jgi:hypothetical protein